MLSERIIGTMYIYPNKNANYSKDSSIKKLIYISDFQLNPLKLVVGLTIGLKG